MTVAPMTEAEIRTWAFCQQSRQRAEEYLGSSEVGLAHRVSDAQEFASRVVDLCDVIFALRERGRVQP